MRKLLFLIIIFMVLVGIVHAWTKRSQNKHESTKIQVVASFYPLYFFARQIGGDKADVSNLTPAGTEPHDYEPTTQDLARIENSNLLIVNGGVEPWGNKIKENLQGTDVKLLVAGEGLLTKQLTEEGKTSQDPHVWLNPKLAKKEVEKITNGFIAIDPANANYYKANEQTLNNKLDALDAAYTKGLATCKNRDIITSHAAFAYLADAYGLKQIAIAGLSPDTEPSAQQLTTIANFAKANHIKYIFFEELVSPKFADTIAREIGAKTLVLDPLEGISDDRIKQGENYFTVMEKNLKNLQLALSCNQ